MLMKASPARTATPEPTAGPFQRASALSRRIKLLLWGDAGSGKTTLALQFPQPALIDLEGGADLYGGKFEFDVFRCSTADEVTDAVTWLATHRHPYRTVILDPVSAYWDQLQKKWSDIFLLRNRGSKGYRFEYFDMGPREWQTVKAEHKNLLRLLCALDMNVILTARQKPLYADGAQAELHHGETQQDAHHDARAEERAQPHAHLAPYAAQAALCGLPLRASGGRPWHHHHQDGGSRHQEAGRSHHKGRARAPDADGEAGQGRPSQQPHRLDDLHQSIGRQQVVGIGHDERQCRTPRRKEEAADARHRKGNDIVDPHLVGGSHEKARQYEECPQKVGRDHGALPIPAVHKDARHWP